MLKGGKRSSLRKALGALKDTTIVGLAILANVHSGYMELDIYIVKATNHVELPSKEKHIRGKWIFHSERLGKTLTPNVCARREC
ncbi:putative clathrin assembly protein At5g35200 isoform X1 [Apium graveolens]|uniref:putative clathrin assembly protein At5g35200 isoform X1 n=1 Tax=Apium graveolens TaxID=4045 RepID=UPI003D7A3E66